MMMSRMIILLAMLSMASRYSSASPADGSLVVTSMRPINRCGGPQTALIVVSIGTVDSRDSLLFFDITLSYDTGVFRPQSVLTQGTLASQMDFGGGAALNLLVPGEARVYAGSLLRPAAGNLPLYAFTGPVILPQACGTFMPFGMDYEPEFNAEFKKTYPQRTLSGIQFITVPTTSTDQGVRFEADSAVIPGMDSTAAIAAVVHAESMAGDTITVTTDVEDSAVASLTDGLRTLPTDLEYAVVERSPQRVVVRFVSTGVPVTLLQEVVGVESERRTAVRISATTDSCSCTAPRLQDTVAVRVDRVIQTSVDEQDADERDGTMIVAGRTVHIHTSHEHPRRILIVDILGRTLLTQDLHVGSNTIDLGGLPGGPVMVIMTGPRVVRMNVMLN